MSLFRPLLPLCAALFLAGGCASPSVEQEAAPEFEAEGLHRVTSSGFESAYIRPGAGLSEYGAVHVDDLSTSSLEVTQTTVSGTNRRDWQVTPERQQRLVEAWAAATARVFADYPRQAEGKGTLRIQTSLTRVAPGRASSVNTTVGGAPIHGSSDVVDVSVEFRLLDANDGELLAVIRDRRTIGSLQWTRASGVDIVNLFNSWAALLHTRLSGR